MNRKILFFLLLITGILSKNIVCRAQKFEGNYYQVTDSIINIISNFQSVGDEYFNKGIFPSFRWYNNSNKIIKDENIFFTQIIIFTLEKIASGLSIESNNKIEKIKYEGLNNYPLYENNDRKLTYNFWKTNPEDFFPNSSILNKFSKFKIPDDIDCTSLAYLTLDSVNNQTLNLLKQLFQQHANTYEKTIHNTYNNYEHLPFYSTWIGENMPIELDVCVLTNAICLSFEHKLKINKNDSSSLVLIRDVILSKKHLTAPAYISPSYQKSSVILYHFARLISLYQPEILKDLVPQLISDIEHEISISKSAMETIILFTSLLRLGKQIPVNTNLTNLENDLDYFSFFAANLASGFKNPFKKWFAKKPLFLFKYICPAYNYSLLLEFLVYQNNF